MSRKKARTSSAAGLKTMAWTPLIVASARDGDRMLGASPDFRLHSYVCHACIEIWPADPDAPLQGGTPVVSVGDNGIATT